MCRSDRNGIDDEGHALLDGRLAQVADAKVEQLGDTLPLGVAAGHLEHPR